MRVFITGIAGFIGSHLAETLVRRGDEVVGLDDFNDFLYDPAIKRKNVASMAGSARVIEGDLLDAEQLEDIFSGQPFDVVVHLAALAGVRPSIETPWRYQRVNVEGTALLAHVMVSHGVRRLVFASSSSVYGHNRERPYRETDRVDAPASPYGASKRAGELLLHSLHRVHGLGVSCLRYFTVYGPRQRPEMAIHKFCQAIEDGRSIPLFGDGSTSRDYTYVGDVVAGTVAAIDHADDQFRIYNLGNRSPVRLSELVDKIADALGKEPIIQRLPEQAGDVQHTLASIEAAQRDLGYEPQTSIDEGLRRFVDWLRAG